MLSTFVDPTKLVPLTTRGLLVEDPPMIKLVGVNLSSRREFLSRKKKKKKRPPVVYLSASDIGSNPSPSQGMELAAKTRG